jgi:hypothetical protein
VILLAEGFFRIKIPAPNQLYSPIESKLTRTVLNPAIQQIFPGANKVKHRIDVLHYFQISESIYIPQAA